jgi:hypothetical protein
VRGLMDDKKRLRAIVSIGFLVVGAVHQFTAQKLDHITLALMVLALVPWIAPLIKSLEITGMGKVEFQDVKVKAEAALKTAEENKKRIDASDRQKVVDAEALAVLEQIAESKPDSRHRPLSVNDIKRALENASPMVKVLAYGKSQRTAA